MRVPLSGLPTSFFRSGVVICKYGNSVAIPSTIKQVEDVSTLKIYPLEEWVSSPRVAEDRKANLSISYRAGNSLQCSAISHQPANPLTRRSFLHSYSESTTCDPYMTNTNSADTCRYVFLDRKS